MISNINNKIQKSNWWVNSLFNSSFQPEQTSAFNSGKIHQRPPNSTKPASSRRLFNFESDTRNRETIGPRMQKIRLLEDFVIRLNGCLTNYIFNDLRFHSECYETFISRCIRWHHSIGSRIASIRGRMLKIQIYN